MLSIYLDCHRYYQQGKSAPGIYKLVVPPHFFEAWCDFDASHGWTVMQSRKGDETVDFNVDWNEYKTGFGNLSTDYWLGKLGK